MVEIIEEKKKVLIGALVAVLVFGIIAVPLFLKKRGMVSPIGQEGKEGQEGLEGELLLWDDQAGFTFQYPEGLYLDDHPEDMENYAHLEISSTKETDGKILIFVSDSETKMIDDWVEKSEEARGAGVLDTTLAEVTAKKLLFEDPKKIVTAAIDPYQGLFLLELYPGKGGYWQKVYDQILKSFVFKPLTEEEQEILERTGGETSTGDENVIYEEEEVIE